MAVSKLLKLVLLSSLILVIFVGVVMMSCDKRSSVIQPPGGGTKAVSNILISLAPNQVRLTSPDASDTVSVAIAAMDSLGVGIPGVQVSLTRLPALGFLVQPETTNGSGIALGTYVCEPGRYDTTRITAHVGDITKSALLAISGPSRYTLHLNYSPPIPKLIDHDADPYNVTATLVDTTQRGVGGQQVVFSVANGVGRLAFTDTSVTIPRTNSQGLCEALFYNTQEDEVNIPNMAYIQAVTRSPDSAGFLAASVNIPLRPVHNTLALQMTRNQVYGDGSSNVIIRAFLRDTDGHGIMGDTIRFTNPDNAGGFGSISVTDVNGMDTVVFTPFGGVSRTDTTRIIAEFQPGTIHQAVMEVPLYILPVRSIGIITASLQKQSILANGIDKSAIYVTVQDSSGGLISDGTPVYFDNNGAGSLFSPQSLTANGQAKDTITAPSHINDGPNVDTIIVRGNANDSTYVADSIFIRYDPGTISSLQFLRPTAPVTLIAGSGQYDSAQVEAFDANGNHVANGTQINFEKQVPTSSMNPSSALTTNGIATSVYLVGSATGVDNVRAWNKSGPGPETLWTVQPVVYYCLSSTATTLQLSTPNPDIQVGGSSTQIIATLEDAYGNPLREGYTVAFHISVSPGSQAVPSEKPSFQTEPGVYDDTIGTNINGQAIVQLYSGTKSGPVSIRACTVPDTIGGLFVCDEKSLVTLSSGPPDSILVNYSGTGAGAGSTRSSRAGAIVVDRYANPVENGTAVYFTMLPTNEGEIDGFSLTGSDPYNDGVIIPGFAPTNITYGCFQTYDYIRIISVSAGATGEIADTSVQLQLPISGGAVSVVADPGNLVTNDGACTSKDTALVTATLLDDGGCPIRGGRILFTAPVAGTILPPTLVLTDSAGHATCLFVIRGCDITCDPVTGICQITAVVQAQLAQKPSVMGVVSIRCSHP